MLSSFRQAVGDDHERFEGIGDAANIRQAEAAAARRELLEETGYEANALIQLCRVCSSPGLTNETVTYFYATELVKKTDGGGVPGEESIIVHKIPLEELNDFVVEQFDGVVDSKLLSACGFISGIFEGFSLLGGPLRS